MARFNYVLTRRDDERHLDVLRMRDEGSHCGTIAFVLGFPRASSVRTILQRIDRDYERSCREMW